MPRGVRHSMHSGVSSIQLLGDVNLEILARPLRIDHDSDCGCPGHQTHTRLIDTTYPPLLAPLYSQLQWASFLDGLNESLRSTAMPTCPLGLGLLLPPVCCTWIYCRHSKALEREEQIQNRISAENERLRLVGLQWTEAVFAQSTRWGCIRSVPLLRGTLTLHMNLSARAAYELDNPQAHQYLANLLVERSMRTGALKGVMATNAATTPSLHALTSPVIPNEGGGATDHPLDETQARLLHRQATLVRKASMSGGKTLQSSGSTAGSQTHASATNADPTRWAQSTGAVPAGATQGFTAVHPDEPTSPAAPSGQRMG